jgi:hypothetical protein
MAAADEIRKIKDSINGAKSEMDRLLGSAEGLDRAAIKASKEYKDQVTILKEGNEQLRERLNLQKQSIDSLIQQEGKLKGLTGLQSSLADQDRQRIQLQDKIDGSYSKTHEALNSIASLNQELLSLSSEDVIAKRHIEDSISNQLYDLIGMEGVTDEIVENLNAQFETAKGISSMTEKQQKFLNKQLAVYEGIKDTIGSVLETASLLTSTVGGVMGSVLMGMGAVANKIGDVNKQLGTTLFQSDGVGRKAGILSFIFEDAAGTAKNLSSELGSTDRATFGLQTNVGLMAMNMGISNSEAATLVGSFSRLNGNSTDVASDMIATSREFAKQNGIIPSQLMGDLAASAEEFALFGKQGGNNILEAAGYAAKLGVNMKTLSGISEGLLDFETSITKELELGAMLGKNINLNRARALAYEGDIEGATKETLKALGGVEAFNRMDYFQKKQTADLLGTSVAELDKMVKYQEQAGTLGGVINEKFSQLGQFIDGGLNKWLGTSLQSLGGMVMAGAQLGGSFAQMGVDVKGLGQKIPGIKKLFGAASDVPTPSVPTPSAVGSDSVSDKLNQTSGGGKKGMNVMNMVKGAAAILILSAALFVAAKAFQEFGSVTWEAVGMGLAGLAGLATIAYILGKAQGPMIQGAAAVAILGAALIPFTFAMSLIENLKIDSILAAAAGLVLFGLAAAGIGMVLPLILAGSVGIAALGASMVLFGAGLMAVGTGFSMIAAIPDMIDGMVSNIGGIMLLTTSLSALAGALIAVGTAGLISIPGLVALGAIGTAVSGINSLLGLSSEESTGVEEGSLSEYNTQMLSKMDELIQVTKSAKDVYLDREKVTGLVISTSEKNSVNKFSLNNA